MGQAAAKENDRITATDFHIEIQSGRPTPPLPHPFRGVINGELSSDVFIKGLRAATRGSTAKNTPRHALLVGERFQQDPTNRAEISTGSGTVKINGKPAARNGDRAMTCNDTAGAPPGIVIADTSSEVFIG